MTLTAKHDGEPASYPDIAQAITLLGGRSSIEADLEQLFRRLAFNVFVGNRDDHLRNHGFLGSPDGWRLSPVFDLNPAPDMIQHSLNLGDGVSGPDIEVVRETARFYRLRAAAADEIIEQVRQVVAGWRDRARELRLGRNDIDRMETAFAV